MIKKGDEIEVEVTDLDSEGRGVARFEDGIVIFAAGSLPGDKSLVKILKKKSAYAEGKTLKVISPSPDRIDALCMHFSSCGGCKIQDLKYEKQLELKAKAVKDAFERIGGFEDPDIRPILPSPEIFFYRNKMEFTFSDDRWRDKMDVEEPGGFNENISVENQKFALGLHVPKFHSKIVDIEECFLQSELTTGIVNFTRKFFKERNIPVYSTKTHSGFLRFLIIREAKSTGDVMVNLITKEYDERLINEFSDKLRIKFPQVTTLVNGISAKKAQVAFSDEEYAVFGSAGITETLTTNDNRTYSFKISSNSFFQTNTGQAENLFKVASEFGDYSEKDNVIDLYCGAGAISLFISGKVNKVLGVELIEDAVSNAKENSVINNVHNADFIASDIKDFMEKDEACKDYNKIILDPPRSGLHPKICELLSDTKFDNLIYVSCNPQTQARDLKIICSKGNYRIDKVQPVDMFPHTYHVENVVKLISL